MPYDRTNEFELPEVFITDPEAKAGIDRTLEMHCFYSGAITEEELLKDWRESAWSRYNVAQVRDGKVFENSTRMVSYDTLGEARAAAYNDYQIAKSYNCDEPNFVVEVRKHTYAGGVNNVVFSQRVGAWTSIALSVDVVDTIRMN